MGRVLVWEEFFTRAEALFRKSPSRTRYSVKYRNCDGRLVLKVTDDKECLVYKTDQAAALKNVEKLQNMFFILMTKGGDAQIDAAELELPDPVAPSVPAAGARKNRRKG